MAPMLRALPAVARGAPSSGRTLSVGFGSMVVSLTRDGEGRGRRVRVPEAACRPRAASATAGQATARRGAIRGRRASARGGRALQIGRASCRESAEGGGVAGAGQQG